MSIFEAMFSSHRWFLEEYMTISHENPIDRHHHQTLTYPTMISKWCGDVITHWWSPPLSLDCFPGKYAAPNTNDNNEKEDKDNKDRIQWSLAPNMMQQNVEEEVKWSQFLKSRSLKVMYAQGVVLGGYEAYNFSVWSTFGKNAGTTEHGRTPALKNLATSKLLSSNRIETPI